MTRRVRSAAFVCSALLSLAGCTGGPTAHLGSRLRVGILESPNSLNPILSTDTAENMINRLIFDPLTSVDEHGNRVPILAAAIPSRANGDITADGKTIRFRLRHGVRWQDGAPFTSKDVAFTFHAIMDPRNDVSSHSGFDQVERVITPDAYTVIFRLKRAFAPALDALFGESDTPQVIIPEHILANEPDLNRAAFNSHPVGTGPFILRRWNRGDYLELAANPRYFRGKPKLDSILVKVIPDENTALVNLSTHEIDWFFEPTARLYPQLRRLSGIRTMLVQTNQFAGMLINTERPFLREPAVRQALAEAIDKNALVKNFTYDSAVVADQDLPPWQWASPKRTPFAGTLTQARATLEQAGFARGPDGVLARDGQRLAFTLSYTEGNATNRLVAVALQSRLRRLGIEITIKSYLPSLLFAPAGMGGILARGTYDLNLSGWVSGVDPDDSTQFMCSNRPPTGSNVTRLCDPAMDAAQRLALSSYDRETRKNAYAKIEQILRNDVPEIFFYYPRGIQAYSSSFAGFAPNSVTESWNAFQWTISSPTTRQ